ncbi:MAG: FAD:protein FMN transferase [Bdellovibrionaceae bacterium]|nr:FAD:protein FMN transferase [Pseudobdellovibrionaceae bacterium]
MKTILFLIALVGLSAGSEAATNSTEVFAVPFNWAGESKDIDKNISSLVEKVKAATPAYDPDCYYSKKQPCSVKGAEVTAQLDKAAAEYKTETDGAFEVVVETDKKKYRDYGGFAQGFVIDQMKKNLKGNYLLNFAGDIYLSNRFSTSPQLVIGVPGGDNIAYAKVVMEKGWMLGSSSPGYGSKTRIPKKFQPKDGAFQYDFKKIVLFANDQFEGARLDAWSTALVVGGKKLLRKLENDQAYKGQWAYFYFDSDGNAVCSANITCSLGSELKNNYVKVVWK